MDAVCNAAGSLPAPVPQSSRHASPADSALWKKEREGRNFSNISDTRGTGITGLSSRIPALTPGTFQWCPQRGIRDAHMITLFRTAYVCTKSCLCGCWKIHQHSFIPQTRNVRPFLAKANCSQTRHCLQGNKQNAGT